VKYAASFLIPLLLGAPGGAQGLAPQAQPRRITMSVRDADLKDLLRAAGEGTDYNLLFDPDLDTRVKGIDLKNVTFQELLDQILPSFGFSYVLTGRTLRITKAEGTMRFYHVDWLSMRRRGSKEFSVSASGQTISTGSGSSSSSSSGGGNSGSSGQDSAYTSSLSSGNGVDPWSEVQLGLGTLVFGEPVQAAQEAAGATGLTPPGSQAFSRNGRTLLIHPESGLVVVNAEPAVQARVARYLEEMRHRTGRQVLLEAKIVEVTLGNDSQIGVDWSAVLTPGAASGGSGTDVSSSFTTGTTLNPNLSATDGLFKFVVTNMRVTATLSALAREGKLQVLSSPRISTMNNQKAILRVVREEAYFLQSSQATPTGSGTGVLVTTTITPLVVPVGIVLDIQPQVADDGMITLAVNPSVSEVVSTRTFSTTGQGGGASATLPVVDRRDLDTVVRMRNGETLVMAGIIKNKEGMEDRGVPFLRKIPILGRLFSKKEKTNSHTELAIFITPTLVEESPDVKAQQEHSEQRLEKSGANLDPEPSATLKPSEP
jgi:MSHA biogenesis protein MshL